MEKAMRIAKLTGRFPFLEFFLKRLFCEGDGKRSDSHSVPVGGARELEHQTVTPTVNGRSK